MPAGNSRCLVKCLAYSHAHQNSAAIDYCFLNNLPEKLLQLVDFESWKSIHSRSEKNSGSISNEGAICVLPNGLEARHLDIHGNIYAFGILLLEIVSGRPPYCEDKGCLVDWVRTRSLNFPPLALVS